jgi:hypothetical protein
MKKILIIFVLSLTFYSSYAFCLTQVKSVSDTVNIDSIYQSLLKMNLEVSVGKNLESFLDRLKFIEYDIGYHEEPTLRLDHITVSYSPDLAFKIYFDCLEYVPRYSSPTSERTWMNDNLIIHEKISKIVLINYKIKPYPFYIKTTSKG